MIRKTGKWTLRVLGTALIFLFTFYLFNAWRISQFANQYDESPADLILVLGAGSHKGQVSPVFRERLNHAIHLFQHQKAKIILITGGLGFGETQSDSKAGADYVIQQGIPPDLILIEEKSTVTYENLKFAKQIMEEHQLKTALLVSDPLHMKRSMGLCQALGIQASTSPTQTSMFRSRKTRMKLLRSEAVFYTRDLLIGRY